MIKGAEHMLKSTEWKKKTKTKHWSPGQCPNNSMVIRLIKRPLVNQPPSANNYNLQKMRDSISQEKHNSPMTSDVLYCL